MGQAGKEPIEPIIDDNLRRIDRRNNIILAVIGIPMAVMALYGFLTGDNILPIMWSELSIVVALGLLYNWAIRKHRVDLRLGCVYTAVGTLITFVLLTIGAAASTAVAIYIQVSSEESFPSIPSLLILLPFGLCVLIVYKSSERIGLRVARSQWERIDYESVNRNYGPLHPVALHLAERKWTNSWFYVLLYIFIEFVPVLLRTPTSQHLFDVIILGGGFIVYLGRACYIWRRG